MPDALLCLLLLTTPVEPDTLVVCPTEFRPALITWEEYRRAQGHEILVVEPPVSPAHLQTTIRRVAQSGRLKYLVLIGDVPGAADGVLNAEVASIPTNYVRANVNTRWGSEPTIATDVPYADVDGDGVPDLAVGRIPADSAEELAAVVRKVIRYEQQVECGPSARRLNVVTGVGGFGVMTDALIEAAGRQVIQQVVPATYEVRHMFANPTHPSCPPPAEFAAHVRGQLSEGCLAWIYLGHGLPTELDRVRTPTGDEGPILSVEDVPQLRCSSATAAAPLAVLVACYTGAIDAPRDCLAEELSLCEQGPIAVIAATRVTMPYGNTILGYELLRACLHDRPAALGDILRLAQCRALGDSTGDTLRTSLDALASGISPPQVDLPAERHEHVLMYQLLGDPLLRLRLPHTDVAQAGSGESIVK